MSDQIANLLKAQIGLLKTIAGELSKLNASKAPLSPGYRRRLSEYRSFDWLSISAEVVAQDAQGVSEVEWSGHRFDRKTGEKFGGKFVIFSRPANGGSDETTYHTLIKFADYNTTPLVSEQGKAKIVLPAKPDLAQPPAPRTQDDSPTAFWSMATQLIQAEQCSHDDAGAIANGTGSWAEKAARLIKEYGPVSGKEVSDEVKRLQKERHHLHHTL
jgi:hypothetical protein